MNEPFTLTVQHDGTAHEFKARFERWGYTHRIAVLIGEVTWAFEPDEEGNYRALTNTTAHISHPGVDMELISAVAATLARIRER